MKLIYKYLHEIVSIIIVSLLSITNIAALSYAFYHSSKYRFELLGWSIMSLIFTIIIIYDFLVFYSREKILHEMKWEDNKSVDDKVEIFIKNKLIGFFYTFVVVNLFSLIFFGPTTAIGFYDFSFNYTKGNIFKRIKGESLLNEYLIEVSKGKKPIGLLPCMGEVKIKAKDSCIYTEATLFQKNKNLCSEIQSENTKKECFDYFK